MSTQPQRSVSSAPAPADDVIRAEGLSKTFTGGAAAVDGLDLSVRRGEIFGLLGPNGAGKTTTVGMLTTRVIPTAGGAVVDGIDVVREPARAKQVIGVVPQTNTLDRRLTAWENLYFHGRYFGMSAKDARMAAYQELARFRLLARAESQVHALSGGMAQRLMVARAILHRPAVVFLDEPTAGLDPQSRIALWEIVKQLHTDGHTIFLTTHYMEEADRLCDRVAIMDQGRILALDTPDGLKRTVRATTAVTVRAEGDLDRLARRLAAIRGATDSKRVDGTVRLHLDGAKGALPSVIAAAEEDGFKLTDLSVSEPTLETVFIDLTGKDLRE